MIICGTPLFDSNWCTEFGSAFGIRQEYVGIGQGCFYPGATAAEGGL